MEVTYKDFENIVMLRYSGEEIEQIKKAYRLANELHSGQFRQSGEPYIIHPINVAYILVEMQSDCDTICAGLLHDVLEDSDITKEKIEELFNEDVANLVDGVTKISKMNYSSKADLNLANIRKLLVSMANDIRVINIKISDRLHNMRTLQYKSPFKQKENATETLEIFVPTAYYVGAYRIRCELEDLSLRYLYPDMYQRFAEKKIKIEEDSRECLQEMLLKIQTMLNDRNIPNEIKIRTKNIYGIYKKITQGYKFKDIHDLFALKIIVQEVEECYRTLYFVHKEYPPVNERFKDYICSPKSNMYQSLHTTVFGPDERLVQARIRTHEMEDVASYGLSAYWNLHESDTRNRMQEELRNKCQFINSLKELDSMFSDNEEFLKHVKAELFEDKIHVYTTKGDIIELPKGSTSIDFAYKIHTDIGNRLVEAYVNDELVPLDYILQNNDRIRIVTDDLSQGPKEEWLKLVRTSRARRGIREFKGKVDSKLSI